MFSIDKRKLQALLALTVLCAEAAERPPITGVAGIAIKVTSLDEARKFYSGVVGLDEAFTTQTVWLFQGQRSSVRRDISRAKERDGRPAHPHRLRDGGRTKIARLPASKNVTVPAKIGKDPNGNLSFEVKDPTATSFSLSSTCQGRFTAATWQASSRHSPLGSYSARGCLGNQSGTGGQLL